MMNQSRNKRSFIWNFFEELPSDTTKVKCTLCGCVLSRSGKGKSASNTSMNNHVRSKHPSEFSSVQKENSTSKQTEEPIPSTSSSTTTYMQKTLKESFGGLNNKWDINDPRAKEIHCSIAEMIAADEQPLSMVEDVGFTRLMAKLKPHYSLPSRKYFSDTILPDIFERCKLAIGSSLKTMTNVSFTTDIWTNSYTNKSFLSLTAHWLNQEMEFQHAMLNVRYFPNSHTALEIKNMISGLLKDWNIADEIVHLIVRDGAANITKGCNDTGFKSATCIIHTLQLVIKSGLLSQRAVSDLLGVAKSLVGHFNHSSVACSKFEKVQLDLSMKPKKLIQDISTRWNSTFYMLERLLELKRPLCVYAAENDIPNLCTNQWQLLESVVKLLSPFEEITRLMSSNESVISEVIPSIKTLLHFLEKESSDHFGCGTMKSTIKRELEKKFPFVKDTAEIESNIENNEHYFLATAIDPRFKLSFFTEMYKQVIKKVLKRKALEELINTCECESATATSMHNPSKKMKMQDENTHNSAVAGNTSQEKGSSIFWQCFDEVAQGENSCDNDESTSETEQEKEIEKEIETFFAIETIKKTDTPFAWWKHHSKTFPHVYKIANKFLCAPSSSVSSERVFSEAGDIYNCKRNRLSTENVEMLVFLHHNLKIKKFNY